MLQDHAGEQALDLAVPAATHAAAELTPDQGAVLAAGARLPLAAAPAGSDGRGATLSREGQVQPGINGLRQRFSWIGLPASGEARYAWQDAAGAREIGLFTKANPSPAPSP